MAGVLVRGRVPKPAMPWACRLLVALALVGPLVWINGLFDGADIPKGMLIQLGALALTLLWLLDAAWTGELRLRTSPVILPLAVCLA
jgi:hypothetical protein